MSSLSFNEPPPAHKPNIQWAVILAAGIIFISGLIYIQPIYRALGPFMVLLIYDLCVVVSALAGAILSILLWRSYERGETLNQIWAGLAFGLAMWSVGEIIWSSDQLWGGNSLPYPSSADVLWILGYIPISWALLKRIRTLRIPPTKWWQRTILIAYGLLAILVVVFIFIPIISDTETSRIYEKSINLFYPLGDLVVALFAIMLVLVLRGGALFDPWRLIAGGFISVAISDLLYGITVWQGSYEINPAQTIDFLSWIINTTYVTFYALVALGLYRQARMQDAL